MDHFLIAWRPLGSSPFFFRGDNRYEIYLPYISEEVVSRGWVRDVAYARVFGAFPDFSEKSFAKNFDVERLRIFPYKGDILSTQILRPTQRPSRDRPLSW